MKFTLTITDATATELERLLQSVNGGSAIGVSTSPAPIAPAPAAAEPEDEDENTPPAAVAPGERDSAGLPWDERIHSGAKSKNADGTWRKKKGVQAEIVTAVEAELRGQAAMQPHVPSVPPAPTTDAPPAPVASPLPPAVGASGAASTPSAPVAAPTPAEPAPAPTPAEPAPAPAPTPAPAPAPAPAAAPAPTPAPAPAAAPNPALRPLGEGELDFGGLMGVISTAMTADPVKLPEARLAELCGLFGVQQIAQIAADPLKIAQAYNWLLQEKLIVGS